MGFKKICEKFCFWFGHCRNMDVDNVCNGFESDDEDNDMEQKLERASY